MGVLASALHYIAPGVTPSVLNYLNMRSEELQVQSRIMHPPQLSRITHTDFMDLI